MLKTNNKAKNKTKKIFRMKSIVKHQKWYTEKEVKTSRKLETFF